MTTYQARASIASGANQTGGITATGGQTVDLSLNTTVGVVSCKWEIYAYPVGFALPAGWTDSSGVYTYNGITPPQWTLDAALWSKYAIRATVNGGKVEAVVGRTTTLVDSSDLIDETLAICVESARGLRGIFPGESNQFSDSWAVEVQKDMKTVEAFAGAHVLKDYSGATLTQRDAIQTSGIYTTDTGAYTKLDLGRIDVREYGAKGDGSTDDRAALNSASAAAAAASKPLYLAPGTYRVSSALALGASLVFAPGASIKPDSGITVTVSGQIQAGQSQVIFDTTASGTFSITWDGEVCALWWAGSDFGSRFNACKGSIDTSASGSGPASIRVTGKHSYDVGLNLTGVFRNLKIDCTGSALTFADSTSDGYAAIDTTGSSLLRFVNLRLSGDTTHPPTIGVLVSRDENTDAANPDSSQLHEFDYPIVDGDWTIAALYNIGSESNKFYGGRFRSDHASARAAIFMGRKNLDSVASAYGTTPGNGSAPTTATNQIFFGTEAWLSAATAGDHKAAFLVYGFDNIVANAMVMFSNDPAHLMFDTTDFDANKNTFNDLYTHGGAGGGTVKPTSSVVSIGTGSVTRTKINLRTVSADTNAFSWGPNTFYDLDVSWYDDFPLICDAAAQMLSTRIFLSQNQTPAITLGSVFYGDIFCGLETQITKASSTYRARVHTSNGTANYAISKATVRSATPAALLSASQATMWVSDGTGITGLKTLAGAAATAGDGDVILSFADSAGTVKHVQLVDYSAV